MRLFTLCRCWRISGALNGVQCRSTGARAASSVAYPLQLSSVSANHGAVYEESLAQPEKFWGDLARNRLRWFKEFDQVMDCDMRQGRISWFNGGKINVSGTLASSCHVVAVFSYG